MKTVGMGSRRHPMWCRDCDARRKRGEKPSSPRFTSPKHPEDGDWPTCPHCGSSNTRSDRVNRRKYQSKRGYCHCHGVPFPHALGSINGCEFQPEDERAPYIPVFDKSKPRPAWLDAKGRSSRERGRILRLRRLWGAQPDDADVEAIREVYREAYARRAAGENVEVDHIYPLAKGGLHVAENLQIISWRDNVRKRANHDE